MTSNTPFSLRDVALLLGLSESNERHRELEESIEEIIRVLLGPPLPGGARDLSQGLVSMFDTFGRRLEDVEQRVKHVERKLIKGIKARVPVRVWVAIIGAVATVFASAFGGDPVMESQSSSPLPPSCSTSLGHSWVTTHARTRVLTRDDARSKPLVETGIARNPDVTLTSDNGLKNWRSTDRRRP